MTGKGVDFKREGPDAARAIIVHVERKTKKVQSNHDRDASSKLQEAMGLAEQIVVMDRGRVMQKLGATSVPDPVRISQRAGVSPARNPA